MRSNKMVVFEGINVKYVLDKENNVWFKGKDVCQILEYKDTAKIIANHLDEKNNKVYDIFKKTRKPLNLVIAYQLSDFL
jgi:prophage antirepressor-like protein